MEFNLIFGNPMGLHIKNGKEIFDYDKHIGTCVPRFNVFNLNEQQNVEIILYKEIKQLASPSFLKKIKELCKEKFFRENKKAKAHIKYF